MQIRRAQPSDKPGLHKLLREVLEVHAEGRPDLFKSGTTKYTDDELDQIIADDTTPIYVAVAEDADPGEILGYAFCQLQDFAGSNNLQPIKTLYLDDLCVDEAARGQHVGETLYHHVLDEARALGCHNVTLHVWSMNPKAQGFYEHMGLKPYFIAMEKVLDS